eukprot:1505296-Prymnesium_polylepis.1
MKELGVQGAWGVVGRGIGVGGQECGWMGGELGLELLSTFIGAGARVVVPAQGRDKTFQLWFSVNASSPAAAFRMNLDGAEQPSEAKVRPVEPFGAEQPDNVDQHLQAIQPHSEVPYPNSKSLPQQKKSLALNKLTNANFSLSQHNGANWAVAMAVMDKWPRNCEEVRELLHTSGLALMMASASNQEADANAAIKRERDTKHSQDELPVEMSISVEQLSAVGFTRNTWLLSLEDLVSSARDNQRFQEGWSQDDLMLRLPLGIGIALNL